MALTPTTRRGLWIVFLICVGLLAATAVMPMVIPRIGSFGESIVATIALVAGVTILLLANIANWQRRQVRIFSILGALSALGALFSTNRLIWYSYPQSMSQLQWQQLRDVYRIASISWTLAGSLTLHGLLTHARLPGALIAIRYATHACVWAVAGLLLYATLELQAVLYLGSTHTLFRLGGALCVTGLFGIIATVVLHKQYAIRSPTPAPLAEQRITLTCPGCGRSQTVGIGQSTCPACRLQFRIEVEAPTCATCGYLLFQLASDVCPECGSAVAASTVAAG